MGFFTNLMDSLQTIFSSWTTVATLVGILVLFIVFMKVKKIKFSSRLIAHIAIVVAMATILDFFKIFKLPNGGSATIASMLPIVLLSIIYGPVIGVFTGFVYSLLNFVIGSPYILHPIQVLFDYTLPFMAIGLSGFFKNNKYLAIGVGFLGMFICNFIAGVVFWGSTAPEGMAPIVYSFLYNGTYNLVNCLICCGVASVINVKDLTKRLVPYTARNAH